MYRTHTCGELRADHAGQRVSIAGWVQRKRLLGGLLFVDLRDHYGITQLVLKGEGDVFAIVDGLGVESVITATGEVLAREDKTVNPNISTGMVELGVEEVIVHSRVDALPIPVVNRSGSGEPDENEEARLRHRYLDLRKKRPHGNIVLRSAVISSLRKRMESQGFVEFQTPILTASSPEGARDYLVPSRLHPGKFYALPQAPQMFKQLLMVGGFDRYFQIAPCFRDEAGRSDRSPGEFYQLDFEMSFVEQDDVFAAIEPVLHGVFEEFGRGKTVSPYPFVRIPYREAMRRFGSDKPDLRNPLEIEDFSALFTGTLIPEGSSEKILGISVPKMSRGACNRMVDGTRTQYCNGVRYTTHPQTGDTIFFTKEFSPPTIYDNNEALKPLGIVRDRLGEELELIDQGRFEFCWIVDFPMYELDLSGSKIEFSHNPFSMPQGGMKALEEQHPLEILAYQYDIVCNGIELSSGAIRNHVPEIMYKAFGIAGYTKAEVDEKFSGMINAFKCGAPPHGGSAPGIDRIVMLLANEPNIREVIAFPMNQQAQDLMMGAPSRVTEKQLQELSLTRASSARERLVRRAWDNLSLSLQDSVQIDILQELCDTVLQGIDKADDEVGG